MKSYFVCPDCQVERTDYEGPNAHLATCPNCHCDKDPVPNQEARLRTYYIPERRILDYLLGRFRITDGIPDGAQVERVFYDPCRQAFGLHVWHESFEEVEPGCLIPDGEVLSVQATDLHVEHVAMNAYQDACDALGDHHIAGATVAKSIKALVAKLPDGSRCLVGSGGSSGKTIEPPREYTAVRSAIEGNSCSDCRGTGKYRGLNEIEDCRTCRGKGAVQQQRGRALDWTSAPGGPEQDDI